MKTFLEFTDRNLRKAKKHLEIIRKIFEKNKFPTASFLEEDDPYIFVKNPNSNLSFDGIRIYKIGDIIAYRVQKEENTHPYGKAYSLDIEDIFNDFISDNMKEKEAGEEVIKSLINEITKFFNKSANAEQELSSNNFNKPFSVDAATAAKPGVSDYSVKVHNGKSYSLF